MVFKFFYFYLSILLVLYISTCLNSQQNVSCTNDSNCGTNSKCLKNTCVCENGFKKHETICIDEKCDYGKCYKCKDSKCQKCVNFIMEDTGKCVDTCSTSSSLKFTDDYQGRVCKAPQNEKKLTEAEIVGIVIGVVLTIVIVVVIFVLIYYFKLSKSSDEASTNKRPESSSSKKQPSSSTQSKGNEGDKKTSKRKDIENNDAKVDDVHENDKTKDEQGPYVSQRKHRSQPKDYEV